MGKTKKRGKRYRGLRRIPPSFGIKREGIEICQGNSESYHSHPVQREGRSGSC